MEQSNIDLFESDAKFQDKSRENQVQIATVCWMFSLAFAGAWGVRVILLELFIGFILVFGEAEGESPAS